MQEQFQQAQDQALQAIAAATTLADLESIRVQFIGRQGLVTTLVEKVGQAPKEQRPILGRAANQLKTAVQQAFDLRKEALESTASAEAIIDTTLPGRSQPIGSLHPIYEVRDRAITILRRLGFSLADGPDIEFEYYNFDALNTPPHHPARNEQDTFYIDTPAEAHPQWGRRLLRSQTSPVQIRALERLHPPIKIIAPGRCYRRDEIDATHGLSFHQMEGLVVDRGVNLTHLKGTLEYFFRELLGADLQFRFRPHFFPFTEPSFEVDCARPGSTFKGREWLEICGCGMVHPNVLTRSGIDPETYTGFAFGFGIERIAMQLYGVPDLRLFTQNHVSFLRQTSVLV